MFGVYIVATTKHGTLFSYIQYLHNTHLLNLEGFSMYIVPYLTGTMIKHSVVTHIHRYLCCIYLILGS